jgi:hypothetical protein
MLLCPDISAGLAEKQNMITIKAAAGIQEI